jgi:hypothetical protein
MMQHFETFEKKQKNKQQKINYNLSRTNKNKLKEQ